MAEEGLFKKIGFDDKKAAENAKNKDLSATLRVVVEEAGVAESGTDKVTGALLYSIATKYPAPALKHRPVIARAIAAKEVTNTNLQPTLDYLKKVGAGDLNEQELRSECGFGVVVSKEQVEQAVAELLKDKSDELKEKRYRVNIGLFMESLRNHPVTKWADGKVMNAELVKQMEAILGPKTEEDLKPLEKKPAAKPKEQEKEKEKEKAEKPKEEELEGVPAHENIHFPDPKDNVQLKPETLKAHFERTGGRIKTRFPPEPNGYLHIGHAKSMHLNFGYAASHGGDCYLRYDDTNPEKEEIEYYNSIREMVEWMGWKPWKITYTSHYFPQLHELAVELIKRGKAYVCHQTKAEMAAGRRVEGQLEGIPSPYRDRSVEENLRLFEDMRKGKYAEGAAVLRLKGGILFEPYKFSIYLFDWKDMNNPNPNMRDHVAYRVMFSPHPIVGDKWCIYPTYDFSHCLVDSLEDIDYSLCTLEFENRHESYDWLVNQLEIYRAHVWEFARLNLQYSVLSKRKIIHLVKNNYVRGWDDPRLSTLVGFRRKGYTPEAINLFCEKIGVTRAPNSIAYTLLEQCLRLDLDPKVNRAMVVLRPLKVVITNLKETEEITVPNHPYENKGSHNVPLTSVIYIEQTDFRPVDEKGYFGLAPGKQVMLKHAHYLITCDDVVFNDKKEIVEIKATLDKDPKIKVKGVLHWVAEGSPRVEIRLYEHLFNAPNLEELGPDFLKRIIDRIAEVVIADAIADVSLKSAKVFDKFQFERQGFFVVDKDSTPEKLVFNRSVTLKESKEKQAVVAPAKAKK